MPTIEVSGTYSPRHNTLKDVVADMLRYDEGEIVEVLEDEPHERLPSTNRFKILVDCVHYTPERWKSYMLRTKEVE